MTQMQRRQQVDTEKGTATEALLGNAQTEQDCAHQELKKAQARVRELEEETKGLRTAAGAGVTSRKPSNEALHQIRALKVGMSALEAREAPPSGHPGGPVVFELSSDFPRLPRQAEAGGNWLCYLRVGRVEMTRLYQVVMCHQWGRRGLISSVIADALFEVRVYKINSLCKGPKHAYYFAFFASNFASNVR
ncbi:MAG: hypothetical protein FJ333_07970, partial [Sphingomonadales bacterium]|nr:hypothetical protein [Sphingomonadales bacterium]